MVKNEMGQQLPAPHWVRKLGRPALVRYGVAAALALAGELRIDFVLADAERRLTGRLELAEWMTFDQIQFAGAPRRRLLSRARPLRRKHEFLSKPCTALAFLAGVEDPLGGSAEPRGV